MPTVRMVEKILCSLNTKFSHVVVVVEKSKNLETLTVHELNVSLQAHEEVVDKDVEELEVVDVIVIKEWE